MDYENFKDQFVEDVKRSLQERGIDDVNITFNKVEKMNESYEAMTVTPEGNSIGMNLNLDKLFSSYENGVDYEEIVSSATNTIDANFFIDTS